MQSLQIMEGLIGTACAIACIYYARHGALATEPQRSLANAPWHSLIGEYARKNPFAAFFGALAFGFLVSSWGMYISPRAVPLPARTVERWHVVTRKVPTADPAQAAQVATLQTTINRDATTIAAQKTEIDRLKQLLGKSVFARNTTRRESLRHATAPETPAVSPELRENTAVPVEPSALANPRGNPVVATPAANNGAPTATPYPTQAQGNAAAPPNTDAANPATAGTAGNPH